MAPEAAESVVPAPATAATRVIFCSAAFALVAATLAAAQAKPPHPDLALYLYAAARVLDGATLYREIVEINPPLIIWFNMPGVLIARLLDISDVLAYRLVVSLVMGTMLVLCARIAARSAIMRAHRPWHLLLIGFALFPLAGTDFGQREHLMLAFLLPYVLLAAARLQGAQVSPRAAFLTGMVAGIGLCLKPHFLLAWLAVDAFRRIRTKADRWRLTPELIGLWASIACYLAVVAAVTPDYFQVAAVLGPAYTSFMQRSLLDVTILAPAAPLVGFALLAFAAHARHAAPAATCRVIAVAAVGCYAAAALQRKGFSYHYYPAIALAFMLLAAIAVAHLESGSWIARTYVRLARAVAITIAVMTAGATLLDAIRPRRVEAQALAGLASAVRARAKSKPVGVLSYTINSAFPLMNDAGTTLATRFPCLWPLATAYWDSLATGGELRYHAPDAMGPAERFMWDAVREDLLTARPEVLVILRPGRDVAHNGLRRLNYVAYFGRHPGLAEFFAGYQFLETRGEYLVYGRLANESSRVGPTPSPEPGQLEAPPATPPTGLDLLDDYSRARLIVFGLVLAAVALADVRRRSAACETPTASTAA
jgi:hypothetical protein